MAAIAVGRVHRWPPPRWPERRGWFPGTSASSCVKTAMGAVVAAALLAPLVLDRPDTSHPILGSTVMVTLGRWSYGLFVWHLAALAMVFPLIGEFMFNGTCRWCWR